mmetsp:Transcript_13251/g.41496  ORF Transcript_13251/g.41496 Transcript_13251/m.41496 type:complete len:226 (+) Transcript_13251:244-921(+)
MAGLSVSTQPTARPRYSAPGPSARTMRASVGRKPRVFWSVVWMYVSVTLIGLVTSCDTTPAAMPATRRSIGEGPATLGASCAPSPPLPPPPLKSSSGHRKTGTKVLPLVWLAYARSGDKGDSANIGVIARRPEYYPVLCAALTEETVAKHMAHQVGGAVMRYLLPGMKALNFVLCQALGGGGLGSSRVDRQGKAYAQVLLTMPVEVPADLSVPRPVHAIGEAAKL